jgi:hypothetical protein
MCRKIREMYGEKAGAEKCTHPKAMALFMIVIVSASFFLYSEMAKAGSTFLGLVCVASLLGVSILVEPHLNVFLPFRRIRAFDKNPALLLIFSCILILVISIAGLLGSPLLIGESDFPNISIILRYAMTLLILGIVFQLAWPYLKNMDLSIEVTPAEEENE